MDAAKCNAGSVPVMDMNPIQKGNRNLENTPSHFVPQEPGKHAGLTGCLAHMTGVDFSSLLRFPLYLLNRD